MPDSRLSQSVSRDFNALSRAESHWIKLARSMDDQTLERKLRTLASFPAQGFMRPQDLRELGAMCFVLARRQEP